LRGADPCKKIEEARVEVTKIEHDGATYYYRKTTSPDNPLGFDFYKFNDSVQSLVSIDHSEPVVNELLDIVQPWVL
jgi:hypothetical protein